MSRDLPAEHTNPPSTLEIVVVIAAALGAIYLAVHWLVWGFGNLLALAQAVIA